MVTFRNQNNSDEHLRIKAYTTFSDGSMLLHRGNIEDLAARSWSCEPSYQAQLDDHWQTMLPLYSACYAVGDIPIAGLQRTSYELFDKLVAQAGALPTTASLVDGCCSIAGITLIPMERLLHIRRVKEIFSISLSGMPPPFD